MAAASRLTALAAAVLALAGCGDERQPPSTVAETVNEARPFEGRLPGKRVDLAGAGYVGVARESVREVAAVGRGAERVSLLLALDRRDGSLCVGYRQVPAPGFVNVDFRCGVDEPVIVYAGRGGDEVDTVGRASLVGVAAGGVRRVEVTFPGGETISPELRPLPGTGLRAFGVEPRGRPLPSALRAVGDAEEVLLEIGLAAIAAAPCAQPGVCVGAAGAWTDTIDPTLG